MHHMKIPAFGCWARRALGAATSIKPWPSSASQQLFVKPIQVEFKHLATKCGLGFQNGPCLTTMEQINIKPKQPSAAALPVQERSIRLKRSHKCCGRLCPDALPRFDLLYYQRTNKFKCDYQQTWNECPELIKRPKIVCCSERIIAAKLKKQPRLERPLTACQQTCNSLPAKCSYITLKGCRPAKCPPKCQPVARVRILNFKKQPAPSPAFSDYISKLPRIRAVECRCLLRPSIGEVWAYNRYRHMIKKLRLY